MPSTMTFDDAVSLVFGGITARGYLNQISVGQGFTVLVNGASGAVGTAMLQLAKVAGAHVTGVTSSRNASFVSALGADRVIPYDETDFVSEGRQYDVIVDCVGNAPVARVSNSLNAGGSVLLVASDLRSLLSASKQATKHGITVITGPGDYRSEDLEYLVDLVERASFVPTIDRTFSFAHISEAHRFVDGGHKRGSVVVTMPSRER
jgi:NADPH:quinone reductase-like Zn-dependent oxidoreductase